MIPTSNHNSIEIINMFNQLYIFWFLHQTTTTTNTWYSVGTLYIFWFLHQTTTLLLVVLWIPSCISFDSYIKPQLLSIIAIIMLVVYLLIPTSNHNFFCAAVGRWLVVYLLIPTSNHNSSLLKRFGFVLYIFWFLHQTTTLPYVSRDNLRLYIFWFLHQTTTNAWKVSSTTSCISFDSYIKPQLREVQPRRWRVVYLLIPTSNHNYSLAPHEQASVVYLLIPTSNHNIAAKEKFFFVLYIFWFLHQTTTRCNTRYDNQGLYIFWFLHQTTTLGYINTSLDSCISFDSYIKPQPSTRSFWR